MLIQIVKYLIKKFDGLVKSLFLSKKLPLIALLILFYLRYQTLPSQIDSSEFLRILRDHSKEINFMKIFLSKFILFDLQGKEYFASYSPTNVEEFSTQLM